MEKRCKLKKGWMILLSLVAFFFLLFLLLLGFYFYNLQGVSSSTAEKEIVIEKGIGSRGVAKTLKERNMIRNEYVFLAYLKLNHVKDLKFGTYLLRENMSVEEIVDALNHGSTYNPDAISITILEGINMREIARVIASKTNNQYESVIEKANDQEYLATLIEKYWFITDDILDEEIFYKLEGYLYPNTYQFDSKDVSVETIFNRMIAEMAKQLEEYKDFDYTTLSIHERLVLASMVEKESPRKSDRTKMASVFLNRKNKGMNLGSDVTTRYAKKIDNKKQKLDDEEFQYKSPYNTRLNDGSMNGRLPIGPISTISKTSIDAAFHPESDNNLYFISNIQTQETFFYENYQDFLVKKAELKEVNQGF